MRTEGHACSTVFAFDRLILFVKGDGPDQTGIGAVAAAFAEVSVKYHMTVLFLFESSGGTGFDARRVFASATDHHCKVAFEPSLCLDLYGAPIKRDSSGIYSTTSEHAR